MRNKKGVYVKLSKWFAILLVLVLSVSLFNGCKKKEPILKVDATKIPKYEKELDFDWSKLPEKQKPEYFAYTIDYMYKLLSINLLEEKDVLVPSREITRGEFVDWMVRSLDLKATADQVALTDIKGNTYEKSILIAAQNNIINKEGAFTPDASLLRADAAIWLINAKGETAKAEAAKYTEPLIQAQDGYDEVLAHEGAAGPLTVCLLPDYQLMYYRWIAGDEFRYIMSEKPMLAAEACYSIFMLNYPPKRGGTITIGQSQEPKTLFSGLDTMSAMSQITSLLYEGFTGGHDEFWGRFPIMIKRIPTFENGLWKITKDDKGEVKSMEVTYELRQGLKWADGSDITADDAVFSYHLYNHPSFPTIHSEMDLWIDDVKAVDNYTIKVFWNTPYLFGNGGIGLMPRKYFESKLNYHLEPFSLVDKTYYDPEKDNPATEEVDESFKSEKFLADEAFINKVVAADAAVNYDYMRNPMHAGAYKVQKWEQGQSIILEANENYIFGKPLIETITFRTIENTDTLLAAAIAGNVDMTLTGLTFDQAMQLEKRESTQKPRLTPSLTWEHIDLNVDNPDLADKRVRQALLHAIDRQSIVDQFFGGAQPVAYAWLPPRHYAYDDSTITKYEFDKKKAESLLDEAGWKLNANGKREKDGKVLTITYMTTAQNKTREQVQAVVASAWKELGIEVITKNEQATSFFTSTLRERKFDGPVAFMYAWVMGPESNLYSIVNSEQCPTPANTFSGQNYTAFKDPTVDKITLENNKKLDKKEVYEGLKVVQEILTKELPSLPLFYRVDVSSCDDALVNFKPQGTSSPLTWNAPWWYWNK